MGQGPLTKFHQLLTTNHKLFQPVTNLNSRFYIQRARILMTRPNRPTCPTRRTPRPNQRRPQPPSPLLTIDKGRVPIRYHLPTTNYKLALFQPLTTDN